MPVAFPLVVPLTKSMLLRLIPLRSTPWGASARITALRRSGRGAAGAIDTATSL